MKIFIGNLVQDVEQDKLFNIFKTYGEIVSFDVLTDKVNGEWNTFAFVEMRKDEEAQTLIQEMNHTELSGQTISVHQARWRAENRRDQKRIGGRRYDD